MITPRSILIGLLLVTISLDAILIFNAQIMRGQGGKILAFTAILVLPAILGSFSLQTHIEGSKTTEFCLSCHVMETYGKSLLVEDNESIPAMHYQNNRIPRENACYTCHTTYTMYGDFSSKLRGLMHIYNQYLGSIPDTIKLADPYNNRECLHCHESARSFEENPIHHATPLMMDSLKSSAISCMASGCHDVIHDVKNISKATFWGGGKIRIPPMHD